jgi:type I restriction enzyme S subunit
MNIVELGQISSMKYGKMLSKDLAVDEGFPVYSGYRITGYSKEYLYNDPMLIVVARGVGGTGDVKISPPNAWITNLSIVLELDDSKVDKQYLCYLLNRENLKDKLNSGAAQAQITIDSLAKYRIRLPPIKQQKKTAEFIAKYDDLIENNRRRIQLLEESARLLYQEWFVHLRFPGHEKVKMIDGVPEGWEIKPISSFGRVITGKTPSTKNAAYYGDDVPFIKTPDMHGNVFVVSTLQSLSESGSKSQQSTLLPSGCIMVSCIGTVGVVSINPLEAHTNQQINSVIPENKHLVEFLFCGLKKIKPMLEAIGASSTMNNVNKSKFSSIEILAPSEKLITEFHLAVASTFELILSLQKQNLALAKARDLLLPKLMSGELTV